MIRPILVATIGVFFAETAVATVIRVASDGSGDFTVLQDAVAAASSGDVVSLAPGHYTQTRWVTSESGASVEVFAWVDQEELAIVGDGRDQVTIGLPNTPADLGSAPAGIVGASDTALTVRGVTVSNVRRGIEGGGRTLTVEDCAFDFVEAGVASLVTEGVQIVDSSFSNATSRGVIVFDVRSEAAALIRGCSFSMCAVGFDVQTLNNIVDNCVVADGNVGGQVSFGGSVTVSDCDFRGQDSTGFGITSGSSAHLVANTIGETQQCVFVSGGLSGSGNVLSGGTFTTISIGYLSVLDFHNNHILNVGGLSVRATGGISTEWPIDLTEDFWGSSDADQIREWISDRDDNPDSWLVVDFEPFHAQPVSTEITSFGRLKAQYLPRQ